MEDNNTVLRYPGGKSRAIDFLINYIPKFKEYREPFVGGASIFLAVKQKFGNDKKYIINDLYTEVYNFWKICQNNPSEIINKIITFKNLYKDQYNEGRLLFQYLSMNKYKFSDIERAASFFIINRSSFSGMSKGYSDDAFKNRFTESSIENLTRLVNSDMFKGVEIYNFDYQNIVEFLLTDEYNHEDVTVVCDPPYYSATSSKLYGKDNKFDNLHLRFDHMRFASVMKNCSYNWLITYDDSQFIRKLFDWANIIEFDLVYGMGGQKSIHNTNGKTKIGKELLLSNMDINSVKPKQIISKSNRKILLDHKQRTIDDAW